MITSRGLRRRKVSVALQGPVVLIFCPHLSQSLSPVDDLTHTHTHMQVRISTTHTATNQWLCFTAPNKNVLVCAVLILFYFLHNRFGQFLSELSSVLPQIVRLILFLLANTQTQMRKPFSTTQTHCKLITLRNIHSEHKYLLCEVQKLWETSTDY